jgi:hypothetical protein
MSELIKKLEAFRANLVGEDMNYRACLVDEAIERIGELEAEVAQARLIEHVNPLSIRLRELEAALGDAANELWRLPQSSSVLLRRVRVVLAGSAPETGPTS